MVLEFSWNVMAHGDAREGKWRGNWGMEWVASTLHTTSEHGVSSITTADAHASAVSSRLNWRPPVDLNGLVRFAERRNLVSARVQSHFKRSLPLTDVFCMIAGYHYCRWQYRNSVIVLPAHSDRHYVSQEPVCCYYIVLPISDLWRHLHASFVSYNFWFKKETAEQLKSNLKTDLPGCM